MCPAIEMAVLDVQFDTEVYFHSYSACQAADEPMDSLVARNGHMMWAKPTSATTATNWRDWIIKVDNDRVATRP